MESNDPKTIRELWLRVNAMMSRLMERLDAVQRDIRELQDDRKKIVDNSHEQRRDFELLKQRHDDHVKRIETSDNRIWNLKIVGIGAVLSLIGGLIGAFVTSLIKK